MPIERKLKRPFTLTKIENGPYLLTPPQHKGLVLSGGGAKGIGYAGMIHSMDQRGIIKGLTHVSGASAGAMTASLLAVGMSSGNITKLVNELDILKLLDRDGFDVSGCRYDFKNSPQNTTKYGPPLAQCATYSGEQAKTCGTVFYPLNA